MQVSYLIHVKDIDRHLVLLAHYGSGLVHHFQSAADHFVVSNSIELRGGRIFLGVSGVDTVHARTFEHNICFDLQRTQRRARIRSEVRTACATCQNHHLAFVKQTDSLVVRVELADRLHADGCEHPRTLTDCVKRGLQCQRVDHRCQHSHLIAFHTVETLLGT